MGGGDSKHVSTWDDYVYFVEQYYPAPQPQPEPQYDHPPSQNQRYSRTADDHNSLDEVTEVLANAGLQTSNLILGIDFTKSNEWTGKRSFNRKSLHHIGNDSNPYEKAFSIIRENVASLEDDPIPCYGFGDASTGDQDVFSFYPEGRFCEGFEQVLKRYREIVPCIEFSGPTSFAPIIEMAMTIVEQSGGQYHVLVIIADGQATRHVDTQQGRLSLQQQKTVEAMVQASKLPLSIIFVGVGDEPWDMMKELPARAFDNFQCVMSRDISTSQNVAKFALAALISQHKATIGGRRWTALKRVPLPPPTYGVTSFNTSKPSPRYDASSFNSPNASYPIDFPPSAPPLPEAIWLCDICFDNSKDMAFGCGHMTCEECAKNLEICPICQHPIQSKLKLFF